MKKRYYTVANLLLSSLITVLGLGACKTTSHKEIRVVYGPPPSYTKQEEEARRAAEEEYLRQQEYQRQQQEAKERERREREKEMKVVYGPPVSRDMRPPVPDAQGVYDIAETMPSFPGGDAAMVSWIKENLRFPQKAREEGISGRVIVNFIVLPNGIIDGAKVVRSISPLLDAEALRLVKSMPKWTPGRVQGSTVPVRYTIPIKFEP